MSGFEVAEPILNGPYDPPARWWKIEEGRDPEQAEGRRPAGYWYREPGAEDGSTRGVWQELTLANRIRARMQEWREQGRPGLTRVSRDLVAYWERPERSPRLFFAQREAAETVIFLNEARADFLQGLAVPPDEPSPERKALGYTGFERLCCKMATGTGKTTVMAMLAAWSVLNKVNDRSDARFSDTVLAVCPNVTIRNRLREIDPRTGDASVYRTRDLVPKAAMKDLQQGRVIVTNWHVFEPQGTKLGETPNRVAKTGQRVLAKETITIAAKTTSMRGTRYMTPNAFDAQLAQGVLRVLDVVDRDADGNPRKVEVEVERWIESDTALVNRVLGRAAGGKQNVLVLNDEAHHAYRLRGAVDDVHLEDAEEEEEERYREAEATVWMDGLDKISRLRGINFCVDLSATPYFLGNAAGETNTVFPWVVSEFGLADAIESGLVKIPQLAAKDASGEERAAYFNIWHWLMRKLTPAERGGQRASPKPEAILKWAHSPIAMLGGEWQETFEDWRGRSGDARPPVLILVCKNVRIARVIHEWLADGVRPTGIPDSGLEALRNRDGRTVTIRVDTKVVHETDSGEAKSDETAWMRHMLDTVGKTAWPMDDQKRPVMPDGFETLAKKLNRPLHPPGRDVRCIVSVGMLTEGWDCNTVTHIVGLRPFMSQLLCEQVIGRGLRRANYEVDPATGRLQEETAKVLGVPFEVIPFKTTANGSPIERPPQTRVEAMPQRRHLRIVFPRVEGYRQSVRNRVTLDWGSVAAVRLDPFQTPPQVQMRNVLLTEQGRMTTRGPGLAEEVTLEPWRRGQRLQQTAFRMAQDLTRLYADGDAGAPPRHVLFPQFLAIVDRYLHTKVERAGEHDLQDVAISPYYGWVLETLRQAVHGDVAAGERPELPVYERNRAPGSTDDVGFWTTRPAWSTTKSHISHVVADTLKWEQSAAYAMETHPNVFAYVKNAGLGFGIPYLHNGVARTYEPDFIVLLAGDEDRRLIIETKGYDEATEIKRQAAERWVRAVTADRQFGMWRYVLVKDPFAVKEAITFAAAVRWDAGGPAVERPLWESLRGSVTVAPGVDLTEPLDEEWNATKDA